MRFLLIFFILLAFNNLRSQDVESGIFHTRRKPKSSLEKNIDNREFSDSTKALKYIKTFIDESATAGFINASVDSALFVDSLYSLFLNKGKKYYLNSLKITSKDETFNEFGSIFGRKNQAFNIVAINEYLNEALTYFENNGYPFTILKLDSINLIKQRIDLVFEIEKGPLYTIDSVYISGDKNINKKIVYQLIDLQPGVVYDEEKIKSIDRVIDQTPFIKLIRNSGIEYAEETVDVFMFLKKEKANYFNGIIGIQPNNKSSDNIIFTGDVSLKLLNSFNHAELIDFNWKKPDQNSQYLNTLIEIPYLLNTPFGVSGNIIMDKKDTSFINIDTYVSTNYLFSFHNRIFLFYKRSNSIVSDQINTEKNYTGNQSYLIGFGFRSNKLDNQINPLKGFEYNFSIAGGKKNINAKELGVPAEIEPSGQNYFEIEGSYSVFYNFYKNFVLHGNTLLKIQKSDFLFANNAYRLGGFNSLKGFDEKSIDATAFNLFNLELRYLYEKMSNVYIFYNLLGYKYKTFNNAMVADYPFGFGLGVNMSTKAGIFSMAYAIGRQFNNPIQLKNAKIHFGFSNTF